MYIRNYCVTNTPDNFTFTHKAPANPLGRNYNLLMSKTRFFTVAFLCFAIAGIAQGKNMLVFDNFNRANNTDLDAESTESVAPHLISGKKTPARGLSEIVNNKLQLGETSAADGWSIAWVDYNFAYDSQVMANAGEFTVSVDIFDLGTGGGTRFSGFGVGNAIIDLADWSANTPNNFTSDFFIGYDPTGTTEVKIFHGGTEAYQQTINFHLLVRTSSVRFYGFSDFNAGTSVSYEASINESIVTTGTFAWSDTNENLINLYSNYTNHTAQFDDFLEISTVPEPSSYALLLGSLALGIAFWRSKQKS